MIQQAQTLRLSAPAALAALALFAPVPSHAAALRIDGSTTVNPVVVKAAEILRAERGLEIVVDTEGGSSGGLAALGDGRVEVAMSSRPLNEADHRKYPGANFRPVRIGIDALTLAVSRDVWEGGVHALTKEQVRQIYQGEIRNWKDVGGPDRRIVFFNKEPGRGTWEVFANWLYGKADEAPLVAWPEVGSNEEGRTKVAGSRGAITELSLAWTDRETVFPLGIRTEDGSLREPSRAHLADGTYPLARSLFVITDGPPKPAAAALLDLLLSPRGQELVRQAGYLALDQLGEGSAAR